MPRLKTLQWSRNLRTERTHDQQTKHTHTVQTSYILWSIQCLFRIVKSILSGKPSIQTADQQNDETARKQRRAQAVCCVTNLQYSVSPRVHCICAALMKYSEPEFRYTAQVRLFSTSYVPSEQFHSEDLTKSLGRARCVRFHPREGRWKLKYNRQHQLIYWQRFKVMKQVELKLIMLFIKMFVCVSSLSSRHLETTIDNRDKTSQQRQKTAETHDPAKQRGVGRVTKSQSSFRKWKRWK